jgi:hypothetical protein
MNSSPSDANASLSPEKPMRTAMGLPVKVLHAGRFKPPQSGNATNLNLKKKDSVFLKKSSVMMNLEGSEKVNIMKQKKNIL